MGYSTLESYFIEDYMNMKDRCKWLEDRLREYEAKETDYEYGITDMHQKFQAVSGNVCTTWVIYTYMLKNGKIAPSRMREIIDMEDKELFDEYKNRMIDYHTVIEYTEHEFQYTLHIKESRDEWTAVTDGCIESDLIKIPDSREYGEVPKLDTWYPVSDAEVLKLTLARNLRQNMEDALDEYERKEVDGDGSAS